MDGFGNASVRALEYAFGMYGAQGLLASSLDLRWSALSAELRIHERGMISWESKPETVVSIAIRPSNSHVTKWSGAVVDRTIAQRGTVWLTPRGLPGGRVDLSGQVQVLHIYLPSRHFSADSVGVNVGDTAHALLQYERSFQDPLLTEIAFAIVSELRAPTAGGKLLAETLAACLAARLVQRNTGVPLHRDFVRCSNQGLDRRRLTRVKEYIAANLEEDLTIAQLAKIASLSQFHFARAFKAAVGQSPHRYVSAHRLERAKELLTRGDQSLLDIAMALNFSSQANFTRAFRISTGLTPGQYRRGRPTR